MSGIDETGLFVTQTCDNLIEENLVLSGYEKIKVDDNSSIYVKYSSTNIEYVDSTRNLHLSIAFAEEETPVLARNRASGESNIAKIREYIGKINKNINTMENWANVIKGILDELTSGLNSALGDVARDLDINNKQLAGLANFMERHTGDLEEWNDAKASYDALKNQLTTEQLLVNQLQEKLNAQGNKMWVYIIIAVLALFAGFVIARMMFPDSY